MELNTRKVEKESKGSPDIFDNIQIEICTLKLLFLNI